MSSCVPQVTRICIESTGGGPKLIDADRYNTLPVNTLSELCDFESTLIIHSTASPPTKQHAINASTTGYNAKNIV